MNQTIKTQCASLRTTLTNALTAVTNIERAGSSDCCKGQSAGKMSTSQRITNLKQFRDAIKRLRDGHAIDFTFTNVSAGEGKVSFRLYGTEANRDAIVDRINDTIDELRG